MRVLLVAAKRTFIDEHVGILEGAGLLPAVVDVDSFALGNAYELSGMINPQAIAAGKLVALVDIGASKTNINIMSDSVSYFTREFYKGGDDLTDSISKKLSLEVKEAETYEARRHRLGVFGGRRRRTLRGRRFQRRQHAHRDALKRGCGQAPHGDEAAGAKPPGCGRRAAEGAAAGMPTASWTAFRASWRTSATTSTFRSILREPVRQEGEEVYITGALRARSGSRRPWNGRSKAGQPLESPAVLPTWSCPRLPGRSCRTIRPGGHCARPGLRIVE